MPYTGLTPGTLTHELEGGTLNLLNIIRFPTEAEETRSYEVGLDSKWFNNTITFGVTYYHSIHIISLLKLHW
nr:TonB-dependent receptor [Bacteroides thetaiotaomicron]